MTVSICEKTELLTDFSVVAQNQVLSLNLDVIALYFLNTLVAVCRLGNFQTDRENECLTAFTANRCPFSF